MATAKIDASAGRFDLVVSDIRMPGMDGIEMAKAAARRFPGLRILLVTGYADQRERAAELNGVIVDVLQKPFTLAEIRERVARALATEADRDLIDIRAPVSRIERAMTLDAAATTRKSSASRSRCALPLAGGRTGAPDPRARAFRWSRSSTAFLDRIEAVNGAVNAIVSLRGARRHSGRGRDRRRAARRRRRARAAVRPADRGQGSGADQGPAHHFRLAHLRRFRAARRTATSSSACAMPAPSSSARPTCRNSASARRPTTRCSARRAMPSTSG